MNIAKIFGQCAKKLKKLTDNELVMLENGLFEIHFSKKHQTVSNEDAGNECNFDDIITQLNDSSSRECSNELLTQNKLTVTQLSNLAKRLDVPCRKGDKKEHLIEKIVEKTVGYKLNSEAVRGNHLF